MNAEPGQDWAAVVDADAVERFVRHVFDGLSGFAPVRLLREKGGPDRPARSSFEPVNTHLSSSLARHAGAAAQVGVACFVVPGTVSGQGRARAQDIVETAVVLVDLDVGDIAAKRAHLVAHLGLPSLEVASGGKTDQGERKLHLYWRLDCPARGPEVGDVGRLRGTLAQKVGGDGTFASPHQPIRVAGSLHCKHGVRTPVEIISETGRRYDLASLAAAAAAMPALDGVAEARLKPKVANLMERLIREGGVDGATRFEALSSVIGHHLRESRAGPMTLSEAWEATRDYNATMIQPPWDEAELRREFDALAAVDLRNHGPLSRRGDAGQHDGSSSEDDLARTLAAAHGQAWKHVAAWGTWLEWTGSHWRRDERDGIVELARAVCQGAAEGLRPNEQRRLGSERTIRAVERLARSDPRMTAGTDEWDVDPMALCTPAGTIDLTTGEIMASDPKRRMTRMTAASPTGTCPLWLKFVDQITGGDAELAAYLARVAGYCLTGSMREQVFFFLHGAGSNGKTVFLGVLANLLGSYAATAPLDSFMASRSDRHPADLAGLDGARMVTVTETEAGRAWAESRIKAITGGDAISVRHMYGRFFRTQPAYKLLIAGNHRPRLAGSGIAMRRRMQLIPFEVTIADDVRDKDLQTKLMLERDGILLWALAGCSEWQRLGLAPPPKVTDAGEHYFDDEDLVGQWITECCEIGTGLHATARQLYASWAEWSQAAGIQPGTARDLGEKLKERGLEAFRTRRARGWKGIAPPGRGRGGA